MTIHIGIGCPNCNAFLVQDILPDNICIWCHTELPPYEPVEDEQEINNLNEAIDNGDFDDTVY